MINISDLSFSIAGSPIFKGASARIPTGHKVGLVGANGAGKTTLFRLLLGELTPDGGDTHIPANARVGSVAQEAPAGAQSVLQTVIDADQERACLLAEQSNEPARIAEIQARLVDIDAWSAEARAAAILNGIGFDTAAQQRPCADFSGGWRMRIALAAVLFTQPDVLLLDEPTNYLDLEGALWLENYLTKYPHTVLLISHDRNLLNQSVGAILHLTHKKLTLYTGNYAQFVKTRQAQQAVQAASAQKQEAQRAHLQSFIDRFKAKASKAKQAQSRIKALQKMTPITPPQEAAHYVFSFAQPSTLAAPIITLENAAVGYNNKPLLSQLNLRIDPDDRIALLGKNGEGKSTFSKLIASELAPISGTCTRAPKLKIGYFSQHQIDTLELSETPLEQLQRALPHMPPAKLRAKLAGFGLGADQAQTLTSKLSGGQKARLSLLLATLDAPHLLILDEPTNHLDIESREALVEALTAYGGAVIIISHDMTLLSLVADRLWLISNGRVTPFLEDLESYKKFLLKKPQAVKNKKPPAAQNTPPTSKQAHLKNAQVDVKKCEARIDKLAEMSKKLQNILADPQLYEQENKVKLLKWKAKYTELEDAMQKAEHLWLQASENYEKLKGI